MPLSVVEDAHAELRRLAVGGARGGARLERLVPKLEALGARAGVFARVAASLRQLTEGGGRVELIAAYALLSAVRSTQSQHAPAGDVAALEPPPPGHRSGCASARQLWALREALLERGEGAVERVKSLAGCLADLRLLAAALVALDTPSVGVAVEEGLAAQIHASPALASAVADSFSGGSGDVRRVGVIAQIDPARAEQLGLQLLDWRPRLRAAERVRLYQRLCASKEALRRLIEEAESLLEPARSTRAEDPEPADPALLRVLAQRREPEATQTILRMLGRGNESAWFEACPYFSEDVQAFLRDKALTAGACADGRCWDRGRWGELVARCGPSPDNVSVAGAVYEAGYFYQRGIAQLVHAHVDGETLARLVQAKLSARRGVDSAANPTDAKRSFARRGVAEIPSCPRGGAHGLAARTACSRQSPPAATSPDFGADGLLWVAAHRFPRERFYTLCCAQGWDEDRALTTVLGKYDVAFDPRWVQAAMDRQRPQLVLSLAAAGDPEAEAYFLSHPKHGPEDAWPRSRNAPVEFRIAEGEGYLIGRAGEGWASFISRADGARRFGLELDLPLEAGANLSLSFRGDLALRLLRARVISEEGEVCEPCSGAKVARYPEWSSVRLSRLPAGRLVRLYCEVDAEGTRGFVQLRGLKIGVKK